MAKNRVGDQTTGRSLDTMKDEKERGITIKSAAITLNLQVRGGLIPHVSEGKFALQQAGPDVDVYVGNLPRGFSRDDFVRLLNENGVADTVDEDGGRVVTHWNSHRGFAIIRTKEALVSSLQGETVEGRPLVIQRSGTDAISRLKTLCHVQGIDPPSFTIVPEDKKSTQQQYTGVATWSSLGGVLIQARDNYATKKEAREAIAQECLEFWYRQKNDHYDAPSEKDEPRENSTNAEQESHHEDEDAATDSSNGNGLVPLVLNLIDSPGHLEFNAEVTGALRVSDGALLVVDAVEGKSAQTDNVLRQALQEGVVPVLMINKVDRLFLDKQLSPKDAYDRMQKVVDDVNNFILAHQLAHFPDLRVSFEAGTVCFGSAYFGWSCTIDSFRHNHHKDDATESDVAAARRALAKRENFIKYIVRPIVQMHRACGVLASLSADGGGKELGMVERVQRIEASLSRARGHGGDGIRLLGSDEDPSTIHPRKLLKRAMMAWLPAADGLTDMVASHVPSPVQAQALRASLLYTGSVTEDSAGQGILNCDPSAPTLVYVSKMSPSPTGKRLLAFGRVFSGTVRPGDILRALRTDGSESEAKVTKVLICSVGGRMHNIPSAGAGQLVALEGVDEALNKAGTLTSSADAMPIRHLNMVVSPVFQRGVRPKNKNQLAKMVRGLHQVVNADSMALFYLDKETQQYILAGTGELHIEILVSSLRQMSGIDVELSDPIVAYRETVQKVSKVALAKSVNKHNRIYIRASPLDEEVVVALASGTVDGLDLKSLRQDLVGNFGWTASDAARIWTVGPEPRTRSELSDAERPTCMLVDSTFGLQIPQDARENIVSAFEQVVHHGIIVHAPMRGVRFDLVDARFHQDSVHRRPNAVVPAASRAMQGAFMMGDPCLVEPMYRVEITGEAGCLNSVYSMVGQRSGTIIDTASTPPSEVIAATLPVRCSFGLSDALHLATKGRAHCTCLYKGMKMVPAGETDSIVAETRKQKSLGDRLPTEHDFIDKL